MSDEKKVVSHRDWLRLFKNCASKYIREGRSMGHRMCGEKFFGGTRCMYYICPRKSEGPRERVES